MEDKGKEFIQAKNAGGMAPAVTPEVSSGIQSMQGGGRSLSRDERSFFEPRFRCDFSNVRYHNDAKASVVSESLNARAFTVGQNIFFGANTYSPHTVAGRKLMAHELAHVIQQGAAGRASGVHHSFISTGAGNVQRDIAEDQLPSTPVEQIMSDDNYFENGIESIEFYSAELAILHYDDGSSIRLGLVPDEITAPFEAVDYRTPRSSHIPVSPTAPSLGRGSIRFLPRGREAEFPPGTTFGDIPRLAEEFGRTIRFTHHPNGRIVPTEVNSISAPRLSEVLREAEAEYVRRFDAMSEGAIEILEKMELIIILGSLVAGLASAGARSAAARGAAGRAGATAAAGIAGRAQSTLVRFFTRLLGRGAAEAITVEGVGFGGVRVATQATRLGTELVVSRTTIVNASRIAGRGRLIHGAFEQAAIQVARQEGAHTARVALELVQNPRWAAYLESQGYTWQLLEHATGVTRVLSKVFTL